MNIGLKGSKLSYLLCHIRDKKNFVSVVLSTFIPVLYLKGSSTCKCFCAKIFTYGYIFGFRKIALPKYTQSNFFLESYPEKVASSRIKSSDLIFKGRLDTLDIGLLSSVSGMILWSVVYSSNNIDI